MSVSTKGFITIDENQTEALNKALYAILRLCERNNILHPSIHPFHLKTLSMGHSQCFYVVFENDREEAGKKIRQLQIGAYGDTVDIKPQGLKISLSIGSWGDSEFIMKSCLAEARKALGKGEVYYQYTDFNNQFEGPLEIDAEKPVPV